MTEVERIVQSGIINQEFLKQEEKNGFLVTTKRKKLFAVLLDLLVQFDAVCKRHNLQYFLCGGTLLGAIRHNGFIPWDDDIDVEMPRDDYDKFIQLGSEFKSPYFLENPHTDKYYAFSQTRLINDNTTALNPMFAFQPFHHGVWLSVFPVDHWMEDDMESFKAMDRLNYDNSTYMRLTNPWLDKKNKERIERWPGKDPVSTYDAIEKIAKKYNSKATLFSGRVVITVLGYPLIFHTEAFLDAIPHDYEGYQFQIPVGWDHILKTQYGDYMQLPPMEKRGNWHSTTIFDPDIPYEEFLEKYKKDPNRVFESQL